ncbi:arabinogalactan endo-1,4-beta-galactosidase [Brucepastera parasyntrophica]|uniref:glycoside hydrolase family 53 protein n=1 Tax=Brucepastera parasyntrophica TaxID=2880008 RepID=UPI00210D3D6D|nr:glycosyl hydrolase 53 family protein [Brucepastera parasyntrophica]ULQ59635.1 arabinogalactan endo-1,4-beta-galactosidase [Brucepastera parasyntrophica]
MNRHWLFLAVFIIPVVSCTTSPRSETGIPLPEMRGADISFYDQLESMGTVFLDNGTERDLLDILWDRNVNWIRLRLWKDPSGHDSWCSLERTLEMARRVKEAGFYFLLDIHYSDWWADPGHQTKPADWIDLSYEELILAVYDYTSDVLRAFVDAGCVPDMVQIGNEITNGMLWPDGAVDYAGPNPFEKLMPLVSSGIQAARETVPGILIMLHLDSGGNNAVSRSWFDAAVSYDLYFDTIGLSYYPFWHGRDLAVLEANLTDLAVRYNKDICIVETSYPWTLDWNDNERNTVGSPAQLVSGYPATPEGQKKYLAALMEIMDSLPGKHGAGIFWWEPDFVAVPGFPSSQENLTWFDFNLEYNGCADVFLGN